MNLRTLCVCLVATLPTMAAAEMSLQSLQSAIAKATSTVGDTTEAAVGAAGDAAGRASGAFREGVDSTMKGLGDEATAAATRAKLDAMAEATLAQLFAQQAHSRALFERSAGYAVFDKREASFYLVAGYGRGLAVDAVTGERVYMKMATTGGAVGIGLGGFATKQVILFENATELREFSVQGLDASAELAAMTGERKDELALRFNDGKAVFELTGKGWKLEARLTGSRYWPDSKLNGQLEPTVGAAADGNERQLSGSGVAAKDKP